MIYDLAHYNAVIVVSKPAARLAVELVDQYWPQPPFLQWFTVGAATAQILADYGLEVDYPAEGDDSEALLALPALQQALAQPEPRVLSTTLSCTVGFCPSMPRAPWPSVSRRNA